MKTKTEIKKTLKEFEEAMKDIRSRESMFFNEEDRNSYLRLKGYTEALKWVLEKVNNDR